LDLFPIAAMSTQVNCVIALGNVASKALDDLKIEHYKLPHPSPKNRKLNCKSFVQYALFLCKVYIDKRTKS
jgi:hypothetical protein